MKKKTLISGFYNDLSDLQKYANIQAWFLRGVEGYVSFVELKYTANYFLRRSYARLLISCQARIYVEINKYLPAAIPAHFPVQ